MGRRSPKALRPDSTVGGAQASSTDRSLVAGVFDTSRLLAFEEMLANLRGVFALAVDRSLTLGTILGFDEILSVPPLSVDVPSVAAALDFEALYINFAVL